MEEVKTKLTAAQYWEWRTTLTELQVAREKHRISELEHKLLQKEAENLGIRTQLFIRTRMESSKQALGTTLAEYERFKGALEQCLGLSLNNKVIDDVTFEIKELPEQTIPKKGEGV